MVDKMSPIITVHPWHCATRRRGTISRCKRVTRTTRRQLRMRGRRFNLTRESSDTNPVKSSTKSFMPQTLTKCLCRAGAMMKSKSNYLGPIYWNNALKKLWRSLKKTKSRCINIREKSKNRTKMMTKGQTERDLGNWVQGRAASFRMVKTGMLTTLLMIKRFVRNNKRL